MCDTCVFFLLWRINPPHPHLSCVFSYATQCGTTRAGIRLLLILCCSCLKYTKVHPVYSLITSYSFSLSAMEHTKPKPRACSRYALSQKKTPQFGCVDASTQTTRPTVMARTNRTSSCLPRYINTLTLKQGGLLQSDFCLTERQTDRPQSWSGRVNLRSGCRGRA